MRHFFEVSLKLFILLFFILFHLILEALLCNIRLWGQSIYGYHLFGKRGGCLWSLLNLRWGSCLYMSWWWTWGRFRSLHRLWSLYWFRLFLRLLRMSSASEICSFIDDIYIVREWLAGLGDPLRVWHWLKTIFIDRRVINHTVSCSFYQITFILHCFWIGELHFVVIPLICEFLMIVLLLVISVQLIDWNIGMNLKQWPAGGGHRCTM